MGIDNLKKIKNSSNIIERTIFNTLITENFSLDDLISESIENLGFTIKKDFFSEDFLLTFVYLDVLKTHISGKENVYNNYHIIINHIEKVEKALEEMSGNSNIQLLEFREWLGISDNFHNTLLAL
ncbi:hypothetical protein [uncultured Clostridium sp.]|uniref:hypothetical protein n=1 Tax=uncultured Clostridium sp. TaxID=59620 RepID=UPI0026062725|nr:hypothetical protein [uncultured Clostridium sp.]